ncbi:SDR family oxidoreductase [Microvirga sp. 2YAF29]|uniref:SDR family oxidoreductase n=1 Tax=Microvirga sp. 2YAF29 TaxID=3233031 RepID=UPI003F9E3DEA
MNLFVFGAGYTASHFITQCRKEFTTICGTARSSEKVQALEETGVCAYRFDGADHDPALIEQLLSADALLVSIPPSNGTDLVLNRFADVIASSSRLRWIGYLSTVGVYGDAQGRWVDEDTAPSLATDRAHQRIEVEQQWLRLGQDASFSVQIFRLAGIYGPGRNALQRVLDGTAKRLVKPGQVFNRIHVDDIAQVLMSSIERPSRSAIYNVADDEPGPPQDVIAYAAELLGCEPPPEVPFEEAHLPPMAHSFYQDNKRVRNTRLKTDLGVALHYPTYREGLQALLPSVLEQGR